MRAVLGFISPFLAAGLMLAAGCGSGDGDDAGPITPGPIDAPSAGSPSSSPPGRPSGSPSGGPSPTNSAGERKVVKRGRKTILPRPVPWKSATPRLDGWALRITWGSGVEPCHVLDRVEVEFRPKTVRVTVYEGSAKLNAVCIQLLVQKTTIVKLSERIGDRRITDGARR